MCIYGISGKIGSGKSTIADIITCLYRRKNITAFQVHFANALKDEVARACNTTRAHIEANKPNFRLILQGWGTDYRRKMFGDDYWVKRWKESVEYLRGENPAAAIIAADVRFKNEAEAVVSMGGRLIRVQRASSEVGSHASEVELDDYKFDTTIVNNGTMKELIEEVERVISL